MHITKISPEVNDIGLTNQIKSHSLLCASLHNNHDKCKCCPGAKWAPAVMFSSVQTRSLPHTVMRSSHSPLPNNLTYLWKRLLMVLRPYWQ